MKNFLYNKLTIQQIALMSIVLAAQLVTNQFLKFSVGPMIVSLNYAFYVLYGLTLGLVPALFTAVIADTMGMVFTGTIGTWMLEYAILPVIIILISWLAKMYLFTAKGKKWLFISISISGSTMLAALLLFIINSTINIYEFNNDHRNSMIVSWIGFTLLAIIYATLYTYFIIKRGTNKNLILFVNIINIFLFISVLLNWLWGPIAFIRFANRFWNYNYTLSGNYTILLIPRILKTPIQVLVWSIIPMSLYYVLKTKWMNNGDNKW